MSWTLARYVSRRFLGALLFACVAVYGLIFVVNLIELLRRSAGEDVSFDQLLGMALLQTPGIALGALPFVVLLSALGAFSRLSRASELVVMRAAGVSAWAAAAPAAALAALLGVASFTVLNPVAAATTARFETLDAKHLKGRESRLSISAEGLWLRQGAGEGQSVIRAAAADATATRLQDVTVFLFDEGDALSGRIDARAAILEPGFWRLESGLRRDVAADMSLDPQAARRFETWRLPTELTADRILDSFAPPEEIAFWSLPGFIRTLEEAGFSADRHRLHWQAQLASPLLYLAMAVVGAAFAMRPARLGGLGAMALASVAAALGFYFVTDVARAIAASGALPPALAAWGPPGAALLFATGAMLRQEEV